MKTKAEPKPQKAGIKHDDGKPRFDLIPPEAEKLLVDVITWGAQEYGDNNWRDLEDPAARYVAALLRHVSAWRRGAKIDPKTGLPHLAHVACNAMFLTELEALKQL
jgi:hypothetical protein